MKTLWRIMRLTKIALNPYNPLEHFNTIFHNHVEYINP